MDEYPIAEGDMFKINEYLSLCLEDGNTMIYVAGKPFRHCKYLQLDISVDEMTEIEGLQSIDEISDTLDHSMEPNPLNRREASNPVIDPEVEFWGHCSNLQVWYENDYNSNLLHSNLAFPLLKALTDAGDPLARRVFKDEIAKRMNSGYLPVIVFLILGGYIMYLTDEEMGTLDFFKKIEGYAREQGDGRLNNRNMMEGFTRYIMEMDPKTPSEWVAKGRFSKALRDPQKTLRIFEEGLEQFPNSEMLMNNYIMELHFQGRWKRAIPYYKEMVDKHPNNSDVWNIYGSLHLRARDYKVAAKCFKKAVKLDPEYVIPKLNLIRAYDRLGYKKVLTDILDKILEMRIKDQKTLEMVVEICDEIGNSEYEIKTLKWMLFLKPERSILWYGLSDIYHQLGKTLHERRCLKKVIELNNDPPVVGNAFNAFAVKAMDNHDIHEALKLLMRAIECNPDNDSAWANLGLALAVKFQLKRGDVAMKIAKLVKRRNEVNRPMPVPRQRKSPEVIRLDQQITSLIREFQSMKFECVICKKTFTKVAKFCPHCGFKLGLSKEDMDKKIDPKKLNKMRAQDPLLSRIPRFPPRLILGGLSHRNWTSLSNLYLKLEATTRDEIKEVNRTLQMLEIEGKLVRRNMNGVVFLKKMADYGPPFF